jgi:hypothetical protein
MPISYEIHPAIGIARVGSSRLRGPEGYFFGPEPDLEPPRKYRDPDGDLKRQAARFRLFRCVRDDRRQLIGSAEIDFRSVRRLSWTVHLVNRKGAARRRYQSGPGYRNHATGDELADSALIIDPGPLSVCTAGERRDFDSGRFRSTIVPLGEILMEASGSLVVLGGYGLAGSDPARLRLDPDKGHRADNDDWFDDTSDGPVSVTIEFWDGSSAESHAWVIVGPPDYAPGITNQVTLYDVISDLAVRRRLISDPAEPPGRPSFTRHIRPIFARAMGYRWVNRAANFGSGDGSNGHGDGGSGDFSKMWSALSDPSSRSAELRGSIAARLRDPHRSARRPDLHPLALIPRLMGPRGPESGPGNVLRLTQTQYKIMQAWARGDFLADHSDPGPSDELLPDGLDRMALEACVGGTLNPGIEANGVILMDAGRYEEGEPFRLSPTAVRPGQVTEYNAVPWQADFPSCRWQESDGPWPMRLGWWPAQRPDDVFREVGSVEMVPWARGLGDDIQDMIEHWDRLGIVVDKGTPGSPFFVEDERDARLLGP